VVKAVNAVLAVGLDTLVAVMASVRASRSGSDEIADAVIRRALAARVMVYLPTLEVTTADGECQGAGQRSGRIAILEVV